MRLACLRVECVRRACIVPCMVAVCVLPCRLTLAAHFSSGHLPLRFVFITLLILIWAKLFIHRVVPSTPRWVVDASERRNFARAVAYS